MVTYYKVTHLHSVKQVGKGIAFCRTTEGQKPLTLFTKIHVNTRRKTYLYKSLVKPFMDPLINDLGHNSV